MIETHPAAEAAAAVDKALRAYLDACAAKAAIVQCGSYWPGDLPVAKRPYSDKAAYPGTRCDRLQDGHGDGEHRARVPGSAVVVTW
jgi:hypothetical protein